VDEDEEYEELVRILEPFRRMRIETGPVTLTEEYLRMIEEVESAPQNHPGAVASKAAVGRPKDRLFLATHEEALRELGKRRRGGPPLK